MHFYYKLIYRMYSILYNTKKSGNKGDGNSGTAQPSWVHVRLLGLSPSPAC